MNFAPARGSTTRSTLDEFAVLELRTCAHQRHEVQCIDSAPNLLGQPQELEGHGGPGGTRPRSPGGRRAQEATSKPLLLSSDDPAVVDPGRGDLNLPDPIVTRRIRATPLRTNSARPRGARRREPRVACAMDLLGRAKPDLLRRTAATSPRRLGGLAWPSRGWT